MRQLAQTNTIPAPDLYIYTYVNSQNTNVNTNGADAVPFLNTVSIPSPTGVPGQLSTLTFNIDPITCRVDSVQDANGNTRNYYPCDQYGNIISPELGQADFGVTSNYTPVVVNNSSGQTVTSSIVGYDNNGDLQSQTDGAGHAVYQVKQWDPVSQFMPAQTEDGNGALTNYQWDQYGNCLKVTGPRGDSTTCASQYPSDFTIGQLQSVTRTSSTGVSQTPTTFNYYPQSSGHLDGFLETVNTPVPGTVGNSSTITTTFNYDTLGDLLSATLNAANNAVNSFTTTYNYTSDPTYGVSLTGPNIGQPLTETDNLGHTTHFQYATSLTSGTYALDSPTRIEDALGNTTDFAFDIANDPIMTILPATGESGTGRSYSQENYEFPGGPCLSEQVYSEQNGTPATYPSSYAPVRQTNYSYGMMGEPLSLSAFNPSTLTSETIQSFRYDADYRITAVLDGNGNTTK